MSDIPQQVLADVDLVQLPSQDHLASIYEAASELAELEMRRDALNKQLEEITDDINKIRTKTLPKMFDLVHVDRLGVPGWNADVVLDTKVHASIKAEWPEEQREKAFIELERLGGEEMVKVEVAVQFGRGDFELAADFVRYARGWNRLAGRTVNVNKTVQWNTLTKFVRELLDLNTPMELPALGASVLRVCNISWRKQK